MIKGIDISRYQNYADWNTVSNSGLGFCYVKATQGLSIASEFAGQIVNVNKSSMLGGCYHYFVCNDDAVKQANLFVSTMQSLYNNDLPPMIDIEDPNCNISPLQFQINLRKFISALNAVGYDPIIYTYQSYWAEKLNNSTSFTDCKLWLAAYENNIPKIIIGNWENANIWQYADTEKIDSVVTDTDYFYGTFEELWKLTNIGTIQQSTNYNPKVIALQSALGIEKPDGYFGPETQNALINAWGVSTVDSALWQKIFKIQDTPEKLGTIVA